MLKYYPFSLLLANLCNAQGGLMLFAINPLFVCHKDSTYLTSPMKVLISDIN